MSDAQAEDILTKVGLWSIITDAGGLDTVMAEEILLSHGQRQLFCLGRAMLKSSMILVLDEATASVDLQTHTLMQEIIKKHFAQCTIIAIAHRLGTIRNFDKVTVFGNRKIVEYRVPGELLEVEGSEFRKL